MFWSIFFQNSPFQTKLLILSGYFCVIFIRPSFANICCPLLSKDSRKKILLFFNSRLKIFWSRVQHLDEKSVGDPENQSWESNRGQQWLSRTGQIKNFQGFRRGQSFVLFTNQTWRDNSNIFKQFFFALCLLIDEEIFRLKKGRKISNYYSKTYFSQG